MRHKEHQEQACLSQLPFIIIKIIKDYHQCNHSPSQLEVKSLSDEGKQFMHKRLQC